MDHSKRQHLTRQLGDTLRSLISAELQPGELIPSQSVLCQRFGVAAGTVVKAVAGLEREGLVVRQHGRGTFVADRKAPLIGVVMGRQSGAADPCEKVLAEAAAEGRLRCRVYRRDGKTDFISRIVADRVQGVLGIGMTREERLSILVKNHIRVVVTDWIRPFPGVSSVGLDSFRAGQLAAETLLHAGHTRIGFVGFQPFDEIGQTYAAESDVELRHAGVITALLNHGLAPDPAHFVRLRLPAAFEIRAGTFTAQDACRQLFQKGPAPTALVYADEKHAEQGLTEALTALGLAAPRDLSAITIKYFVKADPFTAVGCELEALVQEAVDMLLAQLSGATRHDSNRVLVEATLREGHSVAACKQEGESA